MLGWTIVHVFFCSAKSCYCYSNICKTFYRKQCLVLAKGLTHLWQLLEEGETQLESTQGLQATKVSPCLQICSFNALTWTLFKLRDLVIRRTLEITSVWHNIKMSTLTKTLEKLTCSFINTDARWRSCAFTAATPLFVELPSWRTRRKRLASRTLRAARNRGTYRARTNPTANRTVPPASRRHRRPLTSSRSVCPGWLVCRSVGLGVSLLHAAFTDL